MFNRYDNAQRITETGFGLRLDPYSFANCQLTEAIEKLLSDSELYEKLTIASKRIRSTAKHEELYMLIESMVKTKGEHI